MASGGFTDTLWHATARPGPTLSPLGGDLDVEVAVIGAGFTGLTAALALAEAGVSCAVLEAEDIGWGASSRNAGFVVPNFAKVDPDDVVAKLGTDRGERLVDLIGSSGDAVFALIKRLGIECEARQTGWIQGAQAEVIRPRLEARAAQWARRGRPVAVLSKAEAQAMTGCERFVGGWTDRSGGTLHPLNYVRGLAAAAQSAGARIFVRTKVKRMARHGDQWQLVTPRGRVTARRVLLCTNAYVGKLHPVLSRSFIPLRIYQIATEPLEAATAARLLPGRQGAADARYDVFTFRLDGQNRLISGGMPVNPFGAQARMGRGIVQRLVRMLNLSYVPKLQFVWTGTAAVTPDFLPRLHELAPGLFAGIGCNGRGIGMTTVLGGVMAKAAQGVPLNELPVPATSVTALPFHFIARHAPKAALPVGRYNDWRVAGR